MNKVLPGLFIGNIRDSKDQEQLQKNRITHILSIHDNAAPVLKDMKYLCIQIADTPDQNLSQHFHECIQFIHDARASGGSVLVHCLAGVSRSVTVSVAYIATVTEHDWMVCLDAVRQARTVANPNYGFQKQLHAFQENELQKERQWIRGLGHVGQADHDYISGLYDDYKQADSQQHYHVAAPVGSSTERASGSYAAAASPVNKQSNQYP